MPDSYGHAKDFFNPAIADGQLNTQRNLLQFTNGSKSQPKVNDILVLDKSKTNPYGHVAIISAVEGILKLFSKMRKICYLTTLWN
jgi:hypothetical protein